MKNLCLALSMTATLHGAATALLVAEARAGEPWRCEKWNGQACSDAELANPLHFRQILILPAGFTAEEEGLFEKETTRLIKSMSEATPRVYTSSRREKLLYVTHWLPGGALGTPEAVFGAAVAGHPIRGKALTLRQDDVLAVVDKLRESGSRRVSPFGVFVLFNSEETDVTPNASPPSFLGRHFGIAKATRADLDDQYIPMHELAHASLNFVDEYVESGLENMNIRVLDYLTPLAVFKTGWGGWVHAIADLLGFYDYRISEILAANGNDNVDITPHPSRVASPGYTPNAYEQEGGMFFGHGTYHDSGANIMSGPAYDPEDDPETWVKGRQAPNGFDYNHSPSQRGVIAQAFDHPHRAARPNDRLRNAGPLDGVPAALGDSVNLMLFDADKNHRFHPTASYEVQVGWYERDWKVCWKYVVPYPCYDEKWTTAQKTVKPARKTVALKSTKLYALTSVLQKTLCELGIDSVKSKGLDLKLCDSSIKEAAEMFLPTLEFPLPYQDVSVPTRQWMTKYFWRFRALNCTHASGWTGWSEFYRTL